ncbi:capZ-interacting protein [Microcaecilia unicolor]|uniref:CapZ-interacting protein n=1 Tax=Microcaecilia unicolor TaxID=1415580 RepID=A0A6P7Y3Y0_9AMPH|nr:capZ-interacting protein [Microcaecilia unicolor]
MERRSVETCPKEEKQEAPSVAKLAGKFNIQATTVAGKEVLVHKPIRRKPPCSLPLHAPKAESGQNGEEKTSHIPKIKTKSSPLIEKLQASLAFAPATLLPGASPKSPGLKAPTSPFHHSPPSTPTSPSIQTRSSESDEGPVSFENPPEGTHLPCYNKVRTRGSVKRRPPSRRFRKSQSDIEVEDYLKAAAEAEENATRLKKGDEVFEERKEKLKLPEEDGRADNMRTQEHAKTEDKPGGNTSGLENSEDEVRPNESTAKHHECEESSGLGMQKDNAIDVSEHTDTQEPEQRPSESSETVASREPTIEEQSMKPDQKLGTEQTQCQSESGEKPI